MIRLPSVLTYATAMSNLVAASSKEPLATGVSDISVSVVYAPSAHEVWFTTIKLPNGASARDAIMQSGFMRCFPAVDWVSAGMGRFGQRCLPESVLEEGDRVEIYRPLSFDPKESRRRRALHRRQQAKGASHE